MLDEPKTAAPDAEGYVEREFAYCGVRLNSKGGRVVEIRQIGAGDALLAAEWYAYERKYERVIGHVYTAGFCEGGVRGLNVSKWARQWPSETDRISWEAEEQQALTEFRTAKLEADRGKISEIEHVLAPLRRAYAGYVKRRDYAGARSLEAAIIAALQRPMPKDA